MKWLEDDEDSPYRLELTRLRAKIPLDGPTYQGCVHFLAYGRSDAGYAGLMFTLKRQAQ